MIPRRFVQITPATSANGDRALYAIADDGTAFFSVRNTDWIQLPKLPERQTPPEYSELAPAHLDTLHELIGGIEGCFGLLATRQYETLGQEIARVGHLARNIRDGSVEVRR